MEDQVDGETADQEVIETVENPTPDSVHEEAVKEIESEEAKDEKPEEPEEEAEEEKPADEETPPAEDEEEVPVEVPVEAPEPIDPDTTKPGEGKVAIKSFDGKTYYFNNDSEVPEDFEPANYKESMRAAKDFAIKEQNDARNAADKATADAATASATQIKTIQDGWDTDITSLTKAGALPKDEAERKTIVDGVYGLMEAELKAGHTIDSWSQAHEIYMYRQSKVVDADRQKEQNDLKKAKGSVVQSGGSASSAHGTTLKAPPTGMTPDQLHELTLGSL